ncbi:MAG: D-alanine--D-alanine ligase [Myxococcota bacterium]|nr:D-alanine--D-alanine ligase [Myxococcota bacterium]
MRFKRVGVLFGGMSAERHVSIESGNAVIAALGARGYDVVAIDAQDDLDRRLRAAEVEAVYIALHGRLGEDGTVQGMLDVMGMPYTGSSVLSSAVAMDKSVSNALLAASGIPVPKCLVLTEDSPRSLPSSDWQPPIVVKPATGGSSVGVSLVKRIGALDTAIKTALGHSHRAIIEEHVVGTEITVGILDDRILGSLEVEPNREFYNYSAKYAPGGSNHHIPPRLPEQQIADAHDLGLMAYQLLQCTGAARVDFMVPKNARPVLLEVNTIPGMTQNSLLPEIARAAGLSFEDLVVEIMESATRHTRPAWTSQNPG